MAGGSWAASSCGLSRPQHAAAVLLSAVPVPGRREGGRPGKAGFLADADSTTCGSLRNMRIEGGLVR